MRADAHLDPGAPRKGRRRLIGSVHRSLFATMLVVGLSPEPPPPFPPPYVELLPRVLHASSDPVFGDEVDEYAMTHALVLMAATTVGDAETSEAMVAKLRESEMPTGWGMPWEWDAFADGSVNPTTTAYAITTALAIHALLDAGEWVDPAIGEHWRTRLTWYSDQPTDAIWTPNTASMIAAAVARMGHRQEAQVVFDRLAEDVFHWTYSERGSRENDLNHYAYILWGAELARTAGVEVAWSADEAVASLGRYDDVYPIGTDLDGAMIDAAQGPWRMSGTGTALIVAAGYGDSGDWLARTLRAVEEAPLVPRFAAHALLGICIDHLRP